MWNLKSVKVCRCPVLLCAEEPDYVDSDFDGNSTEEDSAEDVEAEEVIAREEKQARRKVRTLILLTYLGDTSRCAISHLGVGSSRVGQTCYDAQATAPTYCS